MTVQVLWRLDARAAYDDTARLAADLLLYLRYAPLTTLLVQVQGLRRAYLAGSGCEGCLHERCEAGCTMQLLRRALAASGARLTPAAHGLTRRPYTRLAVALPAQRAQRLEDPMLEPWSDARLLLTWRVLGGRLMAGAALAVGADGPVPIGALRMAGWAGCCLPKRMLSLAQPGPLQRLPFGGPAPLEPYLLSIESS